MMTALFQIVSAQCFTSSLISPRFDVVRYTTTSGLG
jgi:hypothetical protein